MTIGYASSPEFRRTGPEEENSGMTRSDASGVAVDVLEGTVADALGVWVVDRLD